MKLLIDTREQAPLVFPVTKGVEVIRQGLTVGDYTALHQDTKGEWRDLSVVERKSLADCFGSFVGERYEREKAKWERARGDARHYILAIEGTVTELLQGHTYWAQGTLRESRKSGLAQFRQLLTISRKYPVSLWFCASRKEMAFRVLEYFLAAERIGRPLPDLGVGP